VSCEGFAEGNDTQVCSAGYLSGPGEDRAAAVDFAPDGHVVYAGVGIGNDFGLTPTVLQGGGNGIVVRLTPDGRGAVSVTRLGAVVTDMQVDAGSGNIAVAGDFGVAMLDRDASSVIWSRDVGEATKLALGTDATLAALVDKNVSVFDGAGAELGSFAVGATNVHDIALDAELGLVYVTGFKQDDGAPCSQLQIPYIRAYDYAGDLVWRAYDWNRTQVGEVSECADSRGIALGIGRDGKLYYAGESHGGNTVHRRRPDDLSEFANNVKSDAYNDAYNMNGAAAIAYIARFDNQTGSLDAGQIIVTRLSNGKGNGARPQAITADEHGNILVGGAAACCIEDAESKTINGIPAFSGYHGGGFVFVTPPDFSRRSLWTVFDGPTGGGATPVSVAAAGGRMAAALTQAFKDKATTEAPMIAVDAVGPTPGGGPSDGYLSVFRGPAE
jgi:hypothetical protein